MRRTVWVDSWQQECCGEPFSVGSEVNWCLGDSNRDWLGPLFAGAAVHIDQTEEHHGGLPDGTPTVAAKVVSIMGVQLRYEPRPGSADPSRYPVPGSARLTDLQRSDGEEMRAEGFSGYLVEIDL